MILLLFLKRFKNIEFLNLLKIPIISDYSIKFVKILTNVDFIIIILIIGSHTLKITLSVLRNVKTLKKKFVHT